jgi:hypothetical protein
MGLSSSRLFLLSQTCASAVVDEFGMSLSACATLDAAEIKFTVDQKDVLKNAMMQMADIYISGGLHEAAFLGMCVSTLKMCV